MTTPNFQLRLLVLCLAGAACGGKGNTSDSDDSTSGGQSSTSAGPTTGSSTGPTTGADTSTTGEPTTSVTDTGGTATSIGSQTDSDPTTGAAPTTDDATSTGDATTTSTTGGSEDTGVVPAGDAIVNRECAPNDGPALEFRIDVSEAVCGAGWDGDQLRILLFQPAPLGEGVHELDGGNGFASLQVGMDEPLIANTGSVTITTWSDELVVGTYSLTFSDNSKREGGFSGPFCLTNPMCG